MTKRFEPHLPPIKEHVVTIDELLARNPGKLRIRTEIRDGKEFMIMGVKHPVKDDWHELPLPPESSEYQMWLKGGGVRAVMDKDRGRIPSMLASELPFNDVDVVFVGDEHAARRDAALMGVDPDGVEFAGEDSFDFSKYCYGRDTTQNQICLGCDGLHYSEEARKSAETGHIKIIGQYIANKAIYGLDQFSYKGMQLVKPRGLMRLIKAVSEAHAQSFPYRYLNRYQDIGLYSIFLAKRWQNRDDFGFLLQNEFELLRRMKQVRPGEMDIYDVLTRAHKKYAFFGIDDKIRTFQDLDEWKGKKLARLFDREWAWHNQIPTGLNYPQIAGDEILRTMNLDGFKPTAPKAENLATRWPRFVEECRDRTTRYEAMGFRSEDRIFYDIDDEVPDMLFED